MKGLNAGSGQRPFDPAQGWVNMDIQEKWDPQVVGDWNEVQRYFEGATFDYVVAHHTIEHVGCGDPERFIAGAHYLLKPGGSLLIFMPDMKALAKRWLTGQLDDYQYFVNVYGAYMGDDADRHKWGYTRDSLYQMLHKAAPWDVIRPFDWSHIPGADIARDWWILGMEAVKYGR